MGSVDEENSVVRLVGSQHVDQSGALRDGGQMAVVPNVGRVAVLLEVVECLYSIQGDEGVGLDEVGVAEGEEGVLQEVGLAECTIELLFVVLELAGESRGLRLNTDDQDVGL